MPNPPFSFADLGNLLKAYKLFVEKNDLNLAPSLVSALDKLDSNKNPARRKELADAAVAAFTKWETDQKDKIARAKLGDEIQKLKQAIQTDPSVPPPPPMPSKTAKQEPPKPPTPTGPFKKTTLAAELAKARQGVPFGAAGALEALDEAKTHEEAKPLAEAAKDAIEKELAEIDALVKGTKDDRKLKFSQYGTALRKILQAVKEVAK
jgi:hypothetical protein